MLSYFVALIMIIVVTVVHIYIFLLLEEKTAMLKSILGKVLNVFTFFYLIIGFLLILPNQGLVYKFLGAEPNVYLGILPFGIGLFSGIYIFRKKIAIMKNRDIPKQR